MDRFGANSEGTAFIQDFELNSISNLNGYQNWLRLRCKNNDNTLFYNNNGKAWENISCGKQPSQCKRVACKDPKEHFKHHCKSLDMIKLADANGNVENFARKVYQNGRSNFVWSDTEEEFDLQGQEVYLQSQTTGVQVYPGSQYIVTCNKGHFPFFRFEQAKTSDNWNKLAGATCTATCNKFGEWESTCNCRCNSYESCMSGN